LSTVAPSSQDTAIRVVRTNAVKVDFSHFVDNEEDRHEIANRARLEGIKHFEEQNLMESLSAFDLALQLAPADHRVLANRSLTQLRLGNPDLALVDAQRTIALAPQWPKVHR
jgi:Flp pilus assembly protein TadD